MTDITIPESDASSRPSPTNWKTSMTTDFRALCAELVESVEVLLALRPAEARPLRTTEDRLSRARAALADEPAPCPRAQPASVTEQPSDQELIQPAIEIGLAFQPHPKVAQVYVQYDVAEEPLNPRLIAYARAVLARWGRPAPAPPADGEVGD